MMLPLSTKSCILLLGCLGIIAEGFVPAAQQTTTTSTTPRISTTTTSLDVASARFRGSHPQEEEETHFLLEEFTTHDGEIVNPYNILKIKRDADRKEIRQAYIELSKRYHPDGARHRNILPGRCNDLDDVRDHWERIKLSYEILRDNKTRRRYDRHDMIADPGAAMRRAAFDAASKSVVGVGKGIFNLGSFAVQQLTKNNNNIQDNKGDDE